MDKQKTDVKDVKDVKEFMERTPPPPCPSCGGNDVSLHFGNYADSGLIYADISCYTPRCKAKLELLAPTEAEAIARVLKAWGASAVLAQLKIWLEWQAEWLVRQGDDTRKYELKLDKGHFGSTIYYQKSVSFQKTLQQIKELTNPESYPSEPLVQETDTAKLYDAGEWVPATVENSEQFDSIDVVIILGTGYRTEGWWSNEREKWFLYLVDGYTDAVVTHFAKLRPSPNNNTKAG